VSAVLDQLHTYYEDDQSMADPAAAAATAVSVDHYEPLATCIFRLVNIDPVTWEDLDNRMLLNFAVCRDGKTINFAHIEYYDNSSLSQAQL